MDKREWMELLGKTASVCTDMEWELFQSERGMAGLSSDHDKRMNTYRANREELKQEQRRVQRDKGKNCPEWYELSDRIRALSDAKPEMDWDVYHNMANRASDARLALASLYQRREARDD